MQIDCFYSSSAGNLYRLKSGDALLIECGVSLSKIRGALDFELSGIKGCLVSHSHQDHGGSAKDLMRVGIDCYMSAETAEALNLSGHRLHLIEPLKQFSIARWTILPFETQHDCPGSLGFLLASCGEKILFATDTYYVKYRFRGLTRIMVECNYSPETMDPDIDPILKKRLLNSHFSLANVKKFLLANDLSKVTEIHLLHLSRDNSDSEYFKTEVQALTGKLVFVANSAP